MESVIKYVTGFFSGLMAIFMAIIPVSILWYVLTGGSVFGINVVSNLDCLLDIVQLGEHVPHVGERAELGLVVLRHLRNR